MERIFEIWRSKIPKYDARFKSSLFEPLTNYGGGTEENKIYSGSHFSSAYELYIYAFFLGLYNKQFELLVDVSKVDFSYAIEHWGKKDAGSRKGRESFIILQEYIFYACVARSEVNWLELDKGNIQIKEVVNILIQTLEAYTNGGLKIIETQIEEHPMLYRETSKYFQLLIENVGPK